VSGAPDAAKRAAQGSPLAVGLVAFGAGLVIASLLPETEAERRAAQKLQPTLEDAASGAAEAAREVVEDVKPAVQEAASGLKERAMESADAVKSEARDAASGAADSAKQAAGDLRS